MVASAAPPVVNRLIEGLPRGARDKVLELCEPVDLVFGDMLCETNQPLQHVYFPLTGFISLVAMVHRHPPLEIGLIGNEGMLGATLALDVANARLRGNVQGPGGALRIKAAQFRRELAGNHALRRAIHHYLFVLLAQQSRTIVCTRFHEIKSRLARWLLMTHDRAHADHFHLTHQYLADMLGVQRSAVTIAAGALQRNKVIRYSRGKIIVLDRRGLETASCECYQAVIEDHRRHFA